MNFSSPEALEEYLETEQIRFQKVAIVDTDGVIVRKLAGATVWDHPRYLELIHRLLGP